MTHKHNGDSPESLVRAAIERWRGGERPNAEEFLQAHPEVRQRKSLAIDLIYEEYCLRQEHGETFVASTFMSRFPAYKQSLARMLDVHQFMAGSGQDGRPAWPRPGEEFLGFEIVEQIGAGAVARVYLARELEVGGRQVVIKVSQFGRGEARLLGRLAHPGVVPIHSVREDPLSGMTCICMPFLGTATLVDLLDEAFALGSAPASAQVVERVSPGYLPQGIDPSAWPPLDPFFRGATYEEGIVHLGRQIVAALAKAHQAGITHRDIKPSNVLLSRDGRPMLLDFNLAADERMPAERIGGTLAYMAPERIETLAANRAEVETATDPRSDLYSVGAMLFELLTEQLPSRPPEAAGERQPPLDQWLACRRSAPPSARKFNPRMEPALDAILTRCLAPQPSDRYATADELLTALDAILSPRARLGRALRRRRRTILVAGMGLAAIAAAGGAYWFSLPPLPERLFQAGLRAYDRGEYKQARDYFTQSIEAGNESVDVYFARGQSRGHLADAEGQANDFAQANFKDNEDVGMAWVYAAHAVLNGGQARQSISLFERAQVKGWDCVSVANGLGIAHARAGDLKSGIKQFDRILAVDDNNEDARFNRTICWYQQTNGKYKLAPDKRAITDAEYFAAKNLQDGNMQYLAGSLLSCAASVDPRYVKQAVEYLKAAEQLGMDREITETSWRRFNDNPPAPPTLADGVHRLELLIRFRRVPPSSSPRFEECLQSLLADRRI